MNHYLAALNTLRLSKKKSEEFAAISMFSGGGGLDLGLSLAGFDFRYANDEVQSYCDTISYNFQNCVTEAKDIRHLKGKEIKELIEIEKVSLIAGGPTLPSI